MFYTNCTTHKQYFIAVIALFQYSRIILCVYGEQLSVNIVHYIAIIKVSKPIEVEKVNEQLKERKIKKVCSF